MSSILSPRREIGEFKKRYKWMALVATLTFLVLIGRMVQLQLIEYSRWEAVARENITKTIYLPATRGIIRDRKGRIVATNRPSYSVYVIPQLMGSGDVDKLAELMSLSPDERANLDKRLDDIPPHRRLHQIEMFSDIGRDQVAALETHANELPGVDVVAVPVRTYPYRTLAAHAIGYLNEVNAEDLKKHPDDGYHAGDVIGRTGVEKAWESYLRGHRGYRRVLVNARGERMDMSDDPAMRHKPRRRDPVPGRDLTITLDMDLQRTAERAFRGHPSGAVVAVEAKTGRVLVLFSKPSYDLNEMSGHLSPERFQELVDDPFHPLIDKTIYESYFPGSTFKVISAMAALGDDVLDPNDRVDCPGYFELGNRRFRCTQAHGEVDMKEAITRSCNVYFWHLAEQVGIDRLHKYAEMFGLGRPTGIGINSEASGFIPTREWYEKVKKRFRLGYTLNAAIGQGNVRVTLLQLAMVYAAIANGGTLYVPQIVSEVDSPDGKVIERFAPRVRRHIDIDPAKLEYVREGLVGVVNDPEGTAYSARIDNGIIVAGKTGTAQVAKRPLKKGEDPRRAWYYRRDHAWFAGFAPADDPQIVVVVLVEHGGAGGKAAAPIAMQVIQDYFGASATASAAPRKVGARALAVRGKGR